MRFILTEKQYKLFLLENKNSLIINELKKSNKFFDKILKYSVENFNIDLSEINSYQPSICGFLIPIINFLKKKNPKLTNEQIMLLFLTCTLIYFTDKKKDLNKLLIEIKNQNLIKVFDEMLTYSEKLKSSFLNFLDSLNIQFYDLSIMIGYGFLIPIISKLNDSPHLFNNKKNNKKIIEEIINYLGSLFPKKLVKKILINIFDKIKN